MSDMLKNLAQMLRLRSGPQNMSTSWALMIFLLAAYLAQNLFTGQQFEDENLAAKSLLVVFLQVVVLTGLLFWRRHLERFVQTMSTLTAVGIFFNAITGALLSVSDPTVHQPILAMIWFAVFIWSLFVDAHIYRNALSVSYAIAMLVTVLVLAASYVLIEMVFIFGNP